MHRARFLDALTGLLEEVAAIDARRIDLRTQIADSDPSAVWLTISSPGHFGEAVISDRKLPIYQRKLALQGISLSLECAKSGPVIRLALPV